jgi:hypothetical protein
MSTRTLATGLAVSRILFGLGVMVKPDAAVRAWIGRRSARDPGARTVMRGFGARDVALGIGALDSLSSDRGDARVWFAGQALGEATDFVTTLMADDLSAHGRAFGLTMAGGAAAIALAYAVSPDSHISHNRS